ncbi:helix-turn-helix domain-containing protein [Streptomyces griseorubiginosus]|uniref:helix-turn-helix domain-containing protein n=1 Tax=Streptomyces griseorubiginosus TaxID=67304 RepID=UPI0036EA4A65
MADQERTEDLAQLLARLKSEHDTSYEEIARRIGVSRSAVSSWVNRTRGGKRGPARDHLEALAREYKLDRNYVFEAAGRTSPGPYDADAEARILELYRGLTATQKVEKEVEMRALNELNRTGQ